MNGYQLYQVGDILYNQELSPVTLTSVKKSDGKIKYCGKISLSEICYQQEELISLSYTFSRTEVQLLGQIKYLLIHSPYHELISLLVKVIFFEAKLKNYASKKEIDYSKSFRKINHRYQSSVIVNILLLIVIILLILMSYSFC